MKPTDITKGMLLQLTSDMFFTDALSIIAKSLQLPINNYSISIPKGSIIMITESKASNEHPMFQQTISFLHNGQSHTYHFEPTRKLNLKLIHDPNNKYLNNNNNLPNKGDR